MVDSVVKLSAEVCGVCLTVSAPPETNAMELFPMLTPFLRSEPMNNVWSISVSFGGSSWLTEATGPFTHLVIYPSTSIEVSRNQDTVILGLRKGTSACIDKGARIADIRFQQEIDNDSVKIAATALIEILRFEQVYLLHSAAVAYNGQAVLLAAPSGGGKTTLACVWAAIGNGALMGDDRCLLLRRNEQIFCQGILGPVGLLGESERIISRCGCFLSQNRFPGQNDKLLYDPVQQGWQVERGLCPVGAIVLLSKQQPPDARPSRAAVVRVHECLLHGSAFVGVSEVLKRQFDLITDLVGSVPLVRISSRPTYPGVVGELELAVGRISGDAHSEHRGTRKRGPGVAARQVVARHEGNRRSGALPFGQQAQFCVGLEPPADALGRGRFQLVAPRPPQRGVDQHEPAHGTPVPATGTTDRSRFRSWLS